MGLTLESEGATAPHWPHIRCVGAADLSGRGWAWHDDTARQPCFTAEAVAAPADLVANAIDGRELAGVDRLLAVVRLREESPGGMLRLFRNPCPACGGNHLERATRAIRAVKVIHPGAIEALRAARVPESLLCEPRYLEKGELATGDPEVAKFTLPVWKGDSARTRLAQIAFAHRYALKMGLSMSESSRP